MRYTVTKLARLSGVSARTLRYYDEIGLLQPERAEQNGYRVYEAKQVDRLQQILFYRELGVPLEEIRTLLDARDFDRRQALTGHLDELSRQKARLESLIQNVRKTILTMEGESTMTDKEKFEGFKREMIEENERVYGAEARAKYGDATVNAANERLTGMSEEEWNLKQGLENEMSALLRRALETGDPACADAQKACALHGQWLQQSWAKGMYTKQAHLAMGEMYAADERFAAYYDKIAPGAATFLRDALRVYCA